MTNAIEYWMYNEIILALQEKFDAEMRSLYNNKPDEITDAKFKEVTDEMRKDKYTEVGKISLSLEKMIAQRDEVSNLIKDELNGGEKR